MVQTNSEKFREKGNEKLNSARDETININIRINRMVEALALYYKAYQAAESDNDKASAAKNLGVANTKMIDMQKTTGQNASTIKYYYKEALSYFDKACHFGKICKSYEWQEQVDGQRKACFQSAVGENENASYRVRAGQWEEYTQCMMDTAFKAECFHEIATLIFHEGITALQTNDDYKTCLNDMRECHRPIQEGFRMAGDNEYLKGDLRVLEEDCYLHSCTAESIQARQTGDEMLAEILNQEEVLLMTGVYEVIDWYKKAILLAREKDVEMEAIANSKIGVVYDKIMKSKAKAHDYFRKAIDLANTLSPRNFGSDEWFQKATEALKRYQDEVVQQEDEKWSKEREKYVEQLKPEIQTLREKEKSGVKDFVQHIYKKYPPKKDSFKLEEPKKWTSRDEVKSVLKKALVHYHPDKQKEHGEKWTVICEEIAKILTQKYESYKFGD